MRRTATPVLLAILAVCLAAPPVAPAQSASRKPIAFDDFIRIKRVTDLQLSPDGSAIAFVVTVMDKEANRGASDIWIVSAKGARAEAADLEPGRRLESALVAGREDDRLHLDPFGQPSGLEDRPERRRGRPGHPVLDRRFGRRLVPERDPSGLRLFGLSRLPRRREQPPGRRRADRAAGTRQRGRLPRRRGASPRAAHHLQPYARCSSDPGYRADREAEQALLRPLFTTSFLIDDFLTDHGGFGAQQVLLSSASSKTAYGTAFCLAQRRGRAGALSSVGLTSANNLAFTRSLGCYDTVLSYDELAALDTATPAVYVDFSGSARLSRAVHEGFGDRLTYSCSVGGTHWDELGAKGAGRDLPGLSLDMVSEHTL